MASRTSVMDFTPEYFCFSIFAALLDGAWKWLRRDPLLRPSGAMSLFERSFISPRAS